MRFKPLFLLLALACNSDNGATAEATIKYGMVIHGGAGTILRDNMSAEREAEYRAKLTEAMQAGYAIIEAGGSALSAVEATIKVMENSPLFNSGKGAVFNSAGQNEMDASIMDGRNQNAGAVTILRHVKNPITLARKVLENSPHVLLAENGAEDFAREQGVEIVDAEYFYTASRWESLQRVKDKMEKAKPHGTVGAVALDKAGNLAAGTSTGGMTNKRYGRIGDSPIPGAGTYADNRTCGVSATGHGEFFIRAAVAHDISARMLHGGKSVAQAAHEVIFDEVERLGGSGGVVAMDKDGNITMPFNTAGMYRGYIDENGEVTIAIYGD